MDIHAAVQPQHFGSRCLGNFSICLPKICFKIPEVLAKNLDNLVTRGITALEFLLQTSDVYAKVVFFCKRPAHKRNPFRLVLVILVLILVCVKIRIPIFRRILQSTTNKCLNHKTNNQKDAQHPPKTRSHGLMRRQRQRTKNFKLFLVTTLPRGKTVQFASG